MAALAWQFRVIDDATTLHIIISLVPLHRILLWEIQAMAYMQVADPSWANARCFSIAEM